MATVSQSSRLACLGGEPLFADPLPVGQLYFPSWERYERAMRGIFDRGWYTNHGPLAVELEQRLAEFFGVRHAIVVSNATVGLLMTVKCLDIKGRVIVPGFTFIASAQAVTWAGLEVQFCDVDPLTHQVTPETLAAAMTDEVSAIMAVNLWGGTCAPSAVTAFARARGLNLIFDSAHGVGVQADGRPLGGFGDAEVFSFHATKVLSATEGGCVCTDDDVLAAKLRNMRSSYGAGPPVPVPLTSNGRFSEAQAAVALMSLDDFPDNRAHNERLHDIYRTGLEDFPGLGIVMPADAERSNFQYAVLDVDQASYGLSRDLLLRALHRENVISRRYFYPGVHRVPPYLSGDAVDLPVTDALCSRLLQLPLGALVTEESAESIVGLLVRLRENSSAVESALLAEGR